MSVRSFFGEISRPMQGENIIYQKEGLVTSIKAMKIKGSVGEDSEVLASDGSGGIEWRALDSGGGGVVPSLAEVMGVGGTAGADLDMGEFDINKSSALIISAPSISLSGPVSFTDIPTCPDAASATQPEQLVSKGYVDSAISQEIIASGGVGLDVANTWTAVQNFSGGVTANWNSLQNFSGGAQIQSTVANSCFQVNTEETGADYGVAVMKTNYWVYQGPGTDQDPQQLPEPGADRAGQKIIIINNASANVDIHLSGRIMKFIGIGGTNDAIVSCTFKRYATCEFVCCNTTNGYLWIAMTCSDDNSGWVA